MSAKGSTVSNSTTPSKTAELWSKAFTAKSEWEDKDEFLDIIYWTRQVLGIIIGIVWGMLFLKGMVAIALFGIINCGFVYVYCINFQQIDEEAYGGIWELMKEGFMTSFAGFMVSWIIFYTGLHFETLKSVN